MVVMCVRSFCSDDKNAVYEVNIAVHELNFNVDEVICVVHELFSGP